MTPAPPPSRVFEAIEALKSFDRERAARLLELELRDGPGEGDRWRSVGRLAARIGEIDTAVEAARRLAATQPPTIDRLLHYWGELATFGRTDQALAEVARLPASAREHPALLHFLGITAGEQGDFARAEALYRQALRASPNLPQTWFALAMIKRFSADDPDIEAMEGLRPTFERAEPSLRARFLYGLAKAWHDAGDSARAFALYSEGAALRRAEERYDRASAERQVESLIANFTLEAMRGLIPSRHAGNRAIFVNGLPRSGSTLVEQILTSHSAVSDGGEIGLMRAALIPTGDYSLQGARRYEQRHGGPDPWGAIAAAYERMIGMRFGGTGRIVDKTLVQSRLMGLLLHALPDARILWMRRRPEDAALSCFRTYFTDSVAWSWSLADIGHFFRLEDRLYEHWTGLFGDRILTVPYEDLVGDPGAWIPRIVDHVGLPIEPQVFDFHTTRRSVRTASVQQVRAPISTSRIGAGARDAAHMSEFHAAYRPAG